MLAPSFRVRLRLTRAKYKDAKGNSMTLSKIQQILQAQTHGKISKPDLSVDCACAADLMSDVIAFVKEQVVLLTGLATPAVIRTAELLDIGLVVFVRGKRPNTDMINLAEEANICLLSTELSLFESSGLLYAAGLTQSGFRRHDDCQDFYSGNTVQKKGAPSQS